ncbi:MAG: hypothetical protein DDT20_01796 [Firmicutes bacterium]|nr:hypothetical protein [Bacillota bacterium]
MAKKPSENLTDWAARQRAAVIALAKNWAGQLEGQAKQDAPWKDRTGNARAGLFGSTAVKGNQVFIRVAHSMDYGVLLELGYDGRFAILKPTIDKAIPEIFSSYRRLWE